MCGLVGVYSSNMLAKHKDCLVTLLWLDTLRGRDSTGVAAIRQNTDTVVLKSTVPGYEFVENKALDDLLRYSDFCWIGHNRYGTIGKNIKTNAHPFMVLDDQGACSLVGAHNGTLKNKHVLKDSNNYGTDSEALFYNIAEEGLKETLAKCEGAWALTYYDHSAEELRLVRNKERTLYYAFADEHKTLIWASEIWMIRVASERSGVKLDTDEDGYAIRSVAEDTLYKFPVPLKPNDVITLEKEGGYVGRDPAFFHQPIGFTGATGGRGGGAAAQPLKKTTPQVESKTATSAAALSAAVFQGELLPPTQTEKESASGTTKPKAGKEAGGTQQKKKQTSSEAPRRPVEIVSIDAAKRFKGYNGKFLSRKEIEDQLAGGCSWCELEFITLDERFAWLDKHKPVCRKCLDGVEHVEKSVKPVEVSGVTVH